MATSSSEWRRIRMSEGMIKRQEQYVVDALRMAEYFEHGSFSGRETVAAGKLAIAPMPEILKIPNIFIAGLPEDLAHVEVARDLPGHILLKKHSEGITRFVALECSGASALHSVRESTFLEEVLGGSNYTIGTIQMLQKRPGLAETRGVNCLGIVLIGVVVHQDHGSSTMAINYYYEKAHK